MLLDESTRDRPGLQVFCFSYVCSVCACLDLSVSSSSWGLGRAAVCDCGTRWTFLLPFFSYLKRFFFLLFFFFLNRKKEGGL